MLARARYMADIAEASLADIVLPKEGFDRRIVKEPLGVVLDLPASPEGLVQALHCDHPTSERMVGDARVDHVVFTGSVYGGHSIQQAAAGRFLHVGLELGGNDPAYVAPDCDFDKAVENIVDGAIYNAGQSCCAVERVYVHRALYPRFLEAAEALVRAYAMGDPMDPSTTLGPIAQPHHVAELEALVDDARRKGARVLAGGRKASVDGRGRFFEATLLADLTHEMALITRPKAIHFRL
jgi:acyl-CoA reductase-like NAD-dependent aldehyde dehydrogenase